MLSWTGSNHEKTRLTAEVVRERQPSLGHGDHGRDQKGREEGEEAAGHWNC